MAYSGVRNTFDDAPPPANVPGEDADYANALLSEVINSKIVSLVQVQLPLVVYRPSQNVSSVRPFQVRVDCDCLGANPNLSKESVPQKCNLVKAARSRMKKGK